MKRKVSCIICPMSCVGEIEVEDSIITEVEGFTCQRGVNYARDEILAPKRMLTATVRIEGGELPLLPVVSRAALPQKAIVPCMRCLAWTVAKAPVKEGDVIVPDIMGLGVDIIASRDIGYPK